ncbi:thiosulfate sulfurtransferase [Alkalihalobacillus alcalophilus ATCC 27647 = CGMCC 1.3604]|uniref:Thiosulfate sulfurtransferase n=1 Tax=Alkalihalobacillus alcalophilus ATCC 27647 = CGMCC 1.3604 TaxID=1218173 RepID=A0A094YZD5_ALKAL|nr:sulfurtransferase [Alkalihalobacillus alcalophilus]KGA98922.1 thiosulfate sulfurtransferase [Alkalihalobacillus alcalophilus ATCC 27647 = CGMCC 1.3604]MED1561954.1 sulfurtransferase [Alkalihalobacillus alcalophilus]THG88457.1 thiosulfate sulfurtransferase [Alkalihalobacillus alcalophilus ATCC 27647 = CGMCC 1.3604]
MSVFINAGELPKEVRFIDTRFSLTDLSAGHKAYHNGHINGAIYWDLNQDLSDLSSKNGRHPLPSHEKLQKLFEKSGLKQEQVIALYDNGGEPYATRAYWLLKYAQFPHVYVVNGGFEALQKAGYAIDTAVPHYPETTLELKWAPTIYASREEVKKIVDGHISGVLLDAREEFRYRGESEPIDKIAGHIPSARNYFWAHLKDEQTLAPTEELQEIVSKDEQIVVYCGSGVTASPIYAALKEAGYEKVKLYVGSYSDWITAYEIEKS